MHIVIMGCGRVGSTLAVSLTSLDHSVSVIDQSAASFRRLPPDFPGETVIGVGFDRDVLVEAGVDRAGGFAAVSSGDNSNIISARVARETFGVQNVVARIYDPQRAEVYERLGIPTVATVRWAADSVLRRLLPGGAQTLWQDASGRIVLVEVHVHPSRVGTPVRVLEQLAGTRVAFLTRFGTGQVPADGAVLQEGDVVHVLTDVDVLPRVADALGSPAG